MQLYLCEKPSQARDIAQILGVRTRADGYLHNHDITVTWCFGHLLEMAAPEGYDSGYKRWNLSTLPIVPVNWKMDVKKSARKQYRIIQDLLKRCAHVVIATDADREGETIAREVLAQCGWRGTVSRLWLSALDGASIRKALNQILPGKKTEPLYLAGLGRARADWLVGMNLTRAYTLLGQQQGHEGVLSVGRVQTPTLNLIVERDRIIEAFKPSPYYDVVGTFQVKAGSFTAKWTPPSQITDDEGRCTHQAAARSVAQDITGKQGIISKATTTREQEPPPLPFDLSSLQQAASKRWGMGAQAVLDIAQALYETHKALTYPRTDCRYLPTSQLTEASSVLAALAQSDQVYASFVKDADTKLQSRAWNDKQITAHHAIIPTGTPTDVSKMTEQERQLYDLVCRRYLAQFYPAYEYDKTVIEVTVDHHLFRTVGNFPQVPGWHCLLGSSELSHSEDKPNLPPVTMNEHAEAINARLETKQTAPPVRYTEGTLIAAMKSIGKEISDPKLKQVLRETAGIGTEATRAGIIETLLQRGFVKKSKRHLISTDKGRSLIELLPASIKDPSTTALWEQALEDIAQACGDLDTFITGQIKWIENILYHVQEQVAEITVESQHACPLCAKPLIRRKSKHGWFWGCTAYPECKGALPGQQGQPGSSSQATGQHTSSGTSELCPMCQTGHLVQRTVKGGKNKGKSFLGCTQYPKCNYFAWSR
ncbi:MAG: DNA topoisomerase III [Gammaproteobacteria bacterium]|nr:DNA topoisomerase III [Gammaproteobacteria bacterium]MDH5651241.1 DNA topoisomerase III [Gammaproteobacteria bacterium]